MPAFLYRACDAQGLVITGELEAAGTEEIQTKLANEGLIPLSVRKAGPRWEWSFRKDLFGPRVKLEQLSVMTRQFQTLFKAGMNMESILSTLVRQTSSKPLKEALQRVRSDVAGGASLAAAFGKHPGIFNELYVNMVAAGEEAGILEEVLANLSVLLEKEGETRASVKSATLYPKIVMGVLVVAIGVLTTVIVPKFTSFYAHYKAELPLPTRILTGFSQFVIDSWYLLILPTALLFYAYAWYRKTVRGGLRLGRLQFRVPVFGPLNLHVANARFCYLLSALYRSGLPMTRALEITSGTIENKAFARDVELLKGELVRGRSISEAMAGCRYFTPIVVEATAVGEKTGSLDSMLASVGSHYELEVQHTLKNLTTLLEPILLFFIFGVVIVFTLSIFLPIWNMSRVVTGH